MRIYLFLFCVLVGLISCKESINTKISIDSSYWGEDIIHNESGLDLTMTLYHTDHKGELQNLVLEISNSDWAKLSLPCQEYTLSITELSDSLRILFSDGKQILTKPSERILYGKYQLKEETRYHGDVEIDKPWPIYSYYITEEHYSLAQ